MKQLSLAIIFFLSCVCATAHAQENIIVTIAGDSTQGFAGDSGPAINSILNQPEGLCLDKWGNVYFADAGNSRVRKIDMATGIITTVAGKDSVGYNGDNIAATNAKLFVSDDVDIDTAGNLYIADGKNYRVRKISALTGIITTVAGNGIPGNNGDGGLATNAQLQGVYGLRLDKAGNIYIADMDNYRIRKVNINTGVINTIAGTGVAGFSGDGGLATNAKLNSPGHISIDTSGDVLFSDTWNNAVRKITITTGVISTIAGSPTGAVGYSGDNGPATDALHNQPVGVYTDRENNICIAEYGNGTIRRIDAATGIITTVAGCGVPGFSVEEGIATTLELIPEDMAFDNSGTMYLADYGNNRIRKMYSTVGVPTSPMQQPVSVFPNPVHHELTIQNAGDCKIGVYNFLGQEVIATQGFSNSAHINIRELLPGNYMLHIIQANGEVKNTQFVKN